MENKITLGYWGVRGRAQIPRLLLAYTDAIWEDVTYTAPEQWFQKDKFNLGIPFPNLPYVIDGELKLTESQAINFHIINRSNKKDLAGKNLNDASMVKNLIGVIHEAFDPIKGLCLNKQWQSKKGQVWNKSKPKFDLLHAYIAEKQFALGYLTIVDFYMAEYSYYIQAVFPDILKDYPEWLKAREAINSLPEIKNYYQQENAMKGPFLPPYMVFVQFPSI